VAILVLKKLFCLFNRHQPVRSEAAWDGYHYVSACRHCRHPIRREAHGKWKFDWMEKARG